MDLNIIINGISLSGGQILALRVAVCDYLSIVSKPGSLGSDVIGEAIRENYMNRLEEILELLNP